MVPACRLLLETVTARASPVGFELKTNGFQFYAIANLDKTLNVIVGLQILRLECSCHRKNAKT